MESNQIKEINEAIQAIDVTLGHLNKAKQHLSSAGNWGIFDMVGGGIFSSVMKHGKMNNAKIALQNAKNSVKQLRDELDDVSEVILIELNVGEFLSLADCFLDGVIFDWVVQSRINDTKRQVNEAISKLYQLRSRLTTLIGE